MSSLNARGNYVIVTQNEEKKQSSGGIIFAPDTSIGETKTGHIVSIGPDVTSLVIGQDVIVLWSKGTTVTLDGKLYGIYREDDIAAVVGE